MKKIKLTRGLFAKVDDDMYDFLNQWTWYAKKGVNTFYAARGERVSEGGTRNLIVHMHRQILGISGSKMCGDHRDHDGLNNQRHNLRSCTGSQNGMNKSTVKGVSKFKGVYWHKEKSKWTAEIRLNRKKRHLGYFHSEIDAGLAYNKAAKELFGEFAYLNEIPTILPQ